MGVPAAGMGPRRLPVLGRGCHTSLSGQTAAQLVQSAEASHLLRLAWAAGIRVPVAGPGSHVDCWLPTKHPVWADYCPAGCRVPSQAVSRLAWGAGIGVPVAGLGGHVGCWLAGPSKRARLARPACRLPYSRGWGDLLPGWGCGVP